MQDFADALLRYDDVTPEWMTRALKDCLGDTKVVAVQRGPIIGYKKNKFRAEVTYDRSRPDLEPSYIVKGNFPGEHDPSTGNPWAMAAELRSIRDVAPLVAAPAMPRTYRIDLGTEASSIVMEDLTGKGAIFFNAFKTLDLGQAMAFMDAFARMHASSWNSTSFQPGGAMGPESFAGENRRQINDVYFPTFFTPQNWATYVALPRGRALPAAFQNLDRTQRAWELMWAVLRQAATVVIHGDEHLGNLYVQADGAPGVIDWFARPEHWPIGIGYFMLCSLDIADRRIWDRALLSHYLTRLAAYGATHVPTLEDAWFLYRCAALYPMMTWLNNSGVWQSESSNTANTVRASAAALDYDTFGLLGA